MKREKGLRSKKKERAIRIIWPSFSRKREKIKKEKIKRRLVWTQLDKGTVHFFSKRRNKNLTTFMHIMTKVGDGLVWFVLCVIFLPINLHLGLSMTFASLIQPLFQQIIKHIFVRQRPYVKHDEISNAVLPPDKFSFPSGHTAGAFALVFVFYYLFPVLFIPMLIIAALIAFSRIYLGLHYPTDVIAGVILGFFSAKLGIFLAHLVQMITF